jgi:hypothetical protein
LITIDVKRARSSARTSSRNSPLAWPRSNAPTIVCRRRRDPLLELGVVEELHLGLDQHVEPVRVGRRNRPDQRFEPLLREERLVADVVGVRERGEQVELAVEVMEDRAAREAGLLLEPAHGRPVVAVLGECPAGALEDLGLAGVEMGLAHLGHIPTLQNRTDVLLSRRC